ncbi:MAG: ATP-binding protein [Halobacteriota archaeon]
MRRQSVEALLHSFCDRASDTIWIGSADMRSVQYVNTPLEPIVGISREDVYADPSVYLSVVHPADRDGQRALLADLRRWAASGSAPTQVCDECRIHDVDGGVRWIESRIVPVSETDGTITHWGGVSRDVTDRRERLDTAERQLDALAKLQRHVRHDIRNEAALGLNVLRRVRSAGPTDAEPIEPVEAALGTIADLTETARDLAELIDGLSAARRPIPLDQSVKREVANASTLFEAATVRIEGQLPEVDVRGNDFLSGVFSELLNNAMTHTDATSPEVVISASVSDEEATVAIADNGPGVPDETKRAILDGRRTLLGSSGTGFGLSLSAELVSQFGGRLEIADNDPRGAVLTVTLPVWNGD